MKNGDLVVAKKEIVDAVQIPSKVVKKGQLGLLFEIKPDSMVDFNEFRFGVLFENSRWYLSDADIETIEKT